MTAGVADPFTGLTAVPSPDVIDAEIPSADNDVDPQPVRGCEICGTELSYGGRGRPPTRCDDHKTGRKGPTIDKPASPRGNTKAAKESELVAESIRKSLVKAALLVSLIEPYDGVAIMAGHGEVVNQARGVFETHDKLRAFMLSTKSSGSVAGLIAACLAIALPIAAHHKLIPAEIGGVPIGKALEALPQIVMKMTNSLENATDDMMSRMQTMQDKAKADK